jgi:hypothetical protein
VAVIVLLWLAALAGSSAPDGVHRGVVGPVTVTSQRAVPRIELAEHDERGKRWAMREEPVGKRWC